MSHIVQLIVPTLNAGALWSDFIKAVKSQKGLDFKVLVIDSGSTDLTIQLTQAADWDLIQISKSEFNHGGTRQKGIDRQGEEIEFVVFLTQDAILATQDALVKLIEPFMDPQIAAVYGRQLPHKDANWYAAIHRLIHYPDQSVSKTLSDRDQLGIKTPFFSNSFGAYRIKHLRQAGGFPMNIPLGEDMYACARMLLAGHTIKYCSEAMAYHSHNFSFLEEFKRYCAIGQFHRQERWILDSFGSASKEGLRTILNQYGRLSPYPAHIKIFRFLEILLRSLNKCLGYQIGKRL